MYDLICQNCNSPFQHKWYKKKTCSASCASKLKFKNWSPERKQEWNNAHSITMTQKLINNPDLALQHSLKLKKGYASGRLKIASSCFQTGHEPVNKGKTWEEVVGRKRALEMKLENSLRKKGSIPWNKGNHPEEKYSICKYCGDSFLDKGGRTFCNRSCANSWKEENMSPELREKIIKRHSEAMKKYNSDPDFIKRKSELTKKYYKEHPDAGSIHSKKMKEGYSSGRLEYAKNKIKIARLNQKFNKISKLEDNVCQYFISKGLRENIDFIRQYPYKWLKQGESHGGLCDFFFIKNKIFVEVLGEYWHNLPNYKENDMAKKSFLESQGFIVFHIWEKDFNSTPDLVYKKLVKYIYK